MDFTEEKIEELKHALRRLNETAMLANLGREPLHRYRANQDANEGLSNTVLRHYPRVQLGCAGPELRSRRSTPLETLERALRLFEIGSTFL